eukprot:EG_transcript_6209
MAALPPPGKPPFLLLPADLEAAPALPLHAGCTRHVGRANLRLQDPAVALQHAEVAVSSRGSVTVRCLAAGPLHVVRSAETWPLPCGQAMELYPYDRFWIARPAYSFILISNFSQPAAPDVQLLAEHYRRGTRAARQLVRRLLLAGQRPDCHDVPLDLLVKVLTYVPLSRRPDLSPFHVHPAKLRTGITSFHTPQRPDVGVHLSLYPSGHVGFFAHHPAPMPDATLRLVHLPSEYPILQVVLQDVPTDVSTFGFPLLLKRDALESIAGPEGTVALQVTYAAQRSPWLTAALQLAVRLTDEVLAQAFSKTCAAPLQRARLLVQAKASFPPGCDPGCGSGICSALGYIVREQGLRGLWRGNVLCIARDLATRAIHALIESYTGLEARCSPHNSIAFARLPNYVGRLLLRGLCCTVSPAVSNCLLYPLDVVRTLLAVGVGRSPLQGGAVYAFTRQGGWRRLYHGLVAGSVCLLLHRLTFMLLQDEACRRFRPVRRRRLLLQLMSFAAAFVAYPLDTIKRNQLVRAAYEGRAVSAWRCLRDIVAQRGVAALWNGFAGNLLRSWLTALMLVMFDLLRTPPSKQVTLMWQRLLTNFTALGAVLLLN